MIDRHYPIGIPGQPWGESERRTWRAAQQKKRSHADDVVRRIDALRPRFDVVEYGQLDYGSDECYPLLAVKSRHIDPARPTALITGGVHGYETSGVMGALQFLAQHAEGYVECFNLVVIPCVSPWSYERIQRWNALAIDPNRAFVARSAAPESAALMGWLAEQALDIRVHVDLHETTDSDEQEFRPALAAREGKPFVPGTIPDGFYLVDDTARSQPAFQQAILKAVAGVTHIAEADAAGCLIGSPIRALGVIEYDCKGLGLCAGISDARFVTTTEVYPDSPRTNAAQCNAAQVTAVCAALDFVYGKSG